MWIAKKYVPGGAVWDVSVNDLAEIIQLETDAEKRAQERARKERRRGGERISHRRFSDTSLDRF